MVEPMKPASIELEDDHRCFACGRDNPHGLRMSFRITEKGEIESNFVPEARFQGFKGIMHGGIMSLLLDEMMVNLAWKRGFHAVSAELTVRLKKPARTGRVIKLCGRIVSAEKRIIRTAAEARDESGELLAEAEAVCVRIAPHKAVVSNQERT